MARVRRAGKDPAGTPALGTAVTRAQTADPGAVRVRAAAADPMADEPGILVAGNSGSLRLLDAEHAVVQRAGADAGPGGGPCRVLMLPPRVDPSTGILRREVVVEGWRFELELEPAARAELRARARRDRGATSDGGPVEVRAIIPGVVVGVSVASGDVVEAGQQLLAVEAMKMQNELRAPRAGTVERVAVAVGRTIEVGELLVVIG